MKLFLSESFVNNVVSNLSESRTQDLGKLKAKELQKIRLINLDMRAAKEAIVNIMKGESEEKGNIHYDFSIESFMSLDLNTENITVRNKFRFHDYFERFYSSRHRGYDFEPGRSPSRTPAPNGATLTSVRRAIWSTRPTAKK